jgi:hypothetical protein
MKKIVFLAIIVTLLMTISIPAYAITNGEPDEDQHPYVCIVVMFDNNMNFRGSGSGVLISPNIVLTAGHVADAGDIAFVSFSSEVTYGDITGYLQGIPYTHPDYQLWAGRGLPQFITHDIGIINLFAPVSTFGYGTLPDEGVVDTLSAKTELDVVGYGYNYRERPSQEWIFYGERYLGLSELIASKHKQGDEFIKITCNPSQGKGGQSFGDSGGPVLLGETNTILGVVSYGTNYNSTGVGYAARIDKTDILNWINSYLP